MIIEVSIQNFLSIKEKLTLSLDSSASKRLEENVITVGNDNILKSVAIYGANASGKSNIIKAVHFLWFMVKNSNTFNVDTIIPRIPFKLDEDYAKKPSEFEIIFIQNNVKYRYGFSCTNEGIVKEYLYSWPKGKESLIFSRDETKKERYKFNKDPSKQKAIERQMTNKTLYLSRATALGYDKTKPAYEYVVDTIVVNVFNPGWPEFTAKKSYEDPKIRERVIEILKSADFGGIVDIHPEKHKGKRLNIEMKQEKEEMTFNPNITDDDIYEFKFVHQTKQGKNVEFLMGEESAGTIKTIMMLGPLFEILAQGKTAFIDELELSLHPNIVKFIVKMFNNKNNTNAQLIFTTHSTILLDNEIFRRDQIYICSKKPNQHTILRSLVDFDLREDADFERAYLNGRVGGIPFIDETILK